MASTKVAPNSQSESPTFRNPAKATLLIENFRNKPDTFLSYNSVELTLPTNDEIQFILYCYFKYVDEVIGGDENTWIYLYLNKSNRDKVAVQYRMSILNANGDRRETRDGRSNFSLSGNSRGGRWNIEHAYLLNPANELLVNGSLIIHCEVEEIDNCSSVNSNLVIPNEFNKMSADYKSLLESGKLSDAVLVASEKELHIHKAIVAARSPVFAAMFSHDNTKEAQDNRVEIMDADVEVLEELLKYIYTGKVEALDRYAADLLVAADKYQLEGLKSICEQKLLSEINTQSVSYLFLLADMHQATELTTKCVEYITENGSDVMASEGWKKIMVKSDLVVKLFERLNSKYSNVKSQK